MFKAVALEIHPLERNRNSHRAVSIKYSTVPYNKVLKLIDKTEIKNTILKFPKLYIINYK